MILCMRIYKVIFLLLLVLPSCEPESGHFLSLNRRFTSPSKIITKSYTNYLDAINDSSFPSSSLGFQEDINLHFLAGTLWQVYSLDGSLEWKTLAEKFSEIIVKSRINYENGTGELLHAAFLTPYKITGDQNFYTSIIEFLNQQISASESEVSVDLVSKGSVEPNVEKLMENELLFFASHETGDPVYRELALEFTEEVYQHHFQNSISNEVFYGLANWNTLPRITDIRKLNNDDFNCLSICFYGFTTLYDEVGYEKYGNTAKKLAGLFSSVFEGDNIIVKDKMDLTSRALVYLAQSRLTEIEDSEQTFAKSSDRILKSIMHDLEAKPDPENQEYSFRMYYYLFECIKR